MFCHQCGNAMSVEMRFCQKCGTAYTGQMQLSKNEQMIPENIVVPQKNIIVSWKLINSIIVVIIFIVLWLMFCPNAIITTVTPSNRMTQEIPKNLIIERRKAKESTMRAYLNMIRNATKQFQSDNGCYPNTLEDLVKTSNAFGWDGTNYVDVATTYKGPYLRPQGGVGANKGIPCNPFITSSIPEIAGTSAPFSMTNPSLDAHWVYDHKSGRIWPNIVGRTIDDNTNYADL